MVVSSPPPKSPRYLTQEELDLLSDIFCEPSSASPATSVTAAPVTDDAVEPPSPEETPSPPTKRKRGRPRKAGGKVVTVHIRLTQEEDKRLDREAAARNQDKSELIRYRLFRHDNLDENILAAKASGDESVRATAETLMLLGSMDQRDAEMADRIEETNSTVALLLAEIQELRRAAGKLATIDDVQKLGAPLVTMATAANNISKSLGNPPRAGG